MPIGWAPRPIEEFENPYLRALGAGLKDLRKASGLTAKELALGAGISEPHYWHIAGGTRRTKRSTLARLVAIAVEANPDLGSVDVIVARLCALGGPAVVVDGDDPIDDPIPPALEDLERLWRRSLKLSNAAERARRRLAAVESRWLRLGGDPCWRIKE
jgi:transcriptional regulator with XRE-family HTH domain